jgi:[protein-PII] uridylyltransferase
MSTDPRSLATFIEAQKREIAAAHRAGAGGFETCAALTSLMDGAIRSALQTLPPGTMDHIAVLALGGYGRAELCPYSDIDIMILCASGNDRAAASEAAKTILHFLWDAGLDIGHSVRTIDEALALYGTTFDSWTSMIESRRVEGNEELAVRFYDAMRELLSVTSSAWFIKGVFADVGDRHERYGSSVKLLEPNIKKSAGGMRDLQAAFWLHRGTDSRFFAPLGPGTTALKVFLDDLLRLEILAPDEHERAVRALEFLLRVRQEMHYQRESLHDTLDYSLQILVAEGLGFGSATGLRSVEVFMREYYIHARMIHRVLQQLGQRFQEAIEPAQPSHRGEKIGSTFLLFDDVLTIVPTVREFTDPGKIFEAFACAAEHEVAIDLRLRGTIERSMGVLRPEDAQSAELAASFRRILGSKRVAKTLHAMNELDILPRYIPEFGDLVAFFQHNVYHYYTADEHTLIAVANAEGLREKQGVMHEVFRNLRRKDILYAAILLHDIAKPRGVADHEINGVEMSRVILHRIGMDDAYPAVGFLVRNHLVMEQTAFRRNIDDADTLKEFAARFNRPEFLDYLYILTYADLSALNTSVWTEWKAAMLQDLYQRTAEILRRNLTGDQIDEYQQEKHIEAAGVLVDALSATLPREEVERHVRGIDNASYLAVFDEDQIAQHILVGAENKPVSTFFAESAGATDVTVIARDAPFALSRFCAVLSANDANIFDANIFTRSDGLIIDRFRVTDAGTKQPLELKTCEKISSDLRQVMQGEVDVEHLFREHRKKWKRRTKLPVNPGTSMEVRFEDNPRYTIIDVYAPDGVGFLYRVTETISLLGLDIYFAKIATRLDGIVDAFYVLDRTGQAITDMGKRGIIKEKILETIREVSDRGLEEHT